MSARILVPLSFRPKKLFCWYGRLKFQQIKIPSPTIRVCGFVRGCLLTIKQQITRSSPPAAQLITFSRMGWNCWLVGSPDSSRTSQVNSYGQGRDDQWRFFCVVGLPIKGLVFTQLFTQEMENLWYCQCYLVSLLKEIINFLIHHGHGCGCSCWHDAPEATSRPYTYKLCLYLLKIHTLASKMTSAEYKDVLALALGRDKPPTMSHLLASSIGHRLKSRIISVRLASLIGKAPRQGINTTARTISCCT